MSATALVLSPEFTTRRPLVGLLQRAGYARVLEAEDATEALTLLQSELVSLVLTEWELPQQRGRSLMRSLRNRRRNRNVPVIVLDSGLPAAAAVEAVKGGVAARLTLPASVESLGEALQRVREAQPESAASRARATGQSVR